MAWCNICFGDRLSSLFPKEGWWPSSWYWACFCPVSWWGILPQPLSLTYLFRLFLWNGCCGFPAAQEAVPKMGKWTERPSSLLLSFRMSFPRFSIFNHPFCSTDYTTLTGLSFWIVPSMGECIPLSAHNWGWIWGTSLGWSWNEPILCHCQWSIVYLSRAERAYAEAYRF